MAKWLEVFEKDKEVFLDCSQFIGVKPTAKIFCRNCNRKQKAFAPAALNACKKTRREQLVPPQWVKMRHFCAVCGWLYHPAVVGKLLRTKVVAKDKSQCVYCGEADGRWSPLGMSHLISEIEGGATDENNLVAACGSCHSSKRKSEPRKPTFGRFAK